MQKILILDSIRSAYNVGAIFRTADAAGVKKIYLAGPTPDPIDRFGRAQPEITKTSLGASKSVLWEHVGPSNTRATFELLALIKKLQQEGFVVVAVEQVSDAVLLSDFVVPEKVVYILGAEVMGVQPEILAAADMCVELPMLGMKESLNVSVTAGIVLYTDLM